MSEMTHRERVMAALSGKVTDRVPIAMICSGINAPTNQELDALLRESRGVSLDDFLAGIIDAQLIWPDYKGPKLPEGCDFWGVKRRAVSYGPSSYSEICNYPLAEVTCRADLDEYNWPQAQWFDYSSLVRQIDRINSVSAGGDKCIVLGAGNPFESSWYMRGMEQAMMDLIEEPELFDDIMTRVTDFFIEWITRQVEAVDGRADLGFTADDIGSQTGLLMSLPMWREAIKPHHVRLNRAVHGLGLKVIYHSDGAISQAVGDLVDMGIDILQALQFDATDMDPADLKDRFGDSLCFCGGVSVQSTLPFGTVEDVQKETAERISVLARGGGYILGPSHAVQSGTPPENVLAMFDTALAAEVPSA